MIEIACFALGLFVGLLIMVIVIGFIFKDFKPFR